MGTPTLRAVDLCVDRLAGNWEGSIQGLGGALHNQAETQFTACMGGRHLLMPTTWLVVITTRGITDVFVKVVI